MSLDCRLWFLVKYLDHESIRRAALFLFFRSRFFGRGIELLK